MKPTLSALEAQELLGREFARLKPAECPTCVAPTAFWGPAVVAGPGYWYLKPLDPCRHACGQVLARVWARITTEFEIGRPVGDGRTVRPGAARAKKAAIAV